MIRLSDATSRARSSSSPMDKSVAGTSADTSGLSDSHSAIYRIASRNQSTSRWPTDSCVHHHVSHIVLFDAHGTARDGEPYANTYAWFLTMRDEQVVEATAFFDALEFNELWTRVKAVAP